MSPSAFIHVLRWAFLAIDTIIYGLIESLASLFNLLARGTIFSQTDIDNVMNRVYLLVALIMIFRLAFSFINYIINPEQLVDKQKGGGKLIIQIVVSLILLVFTPTIFNEAYRLQGLLLSENTIGKLITGQSFTEVGEENSFGKNIAYTTFRTFYTISDKVLSENCGIEDGSAAIPADCVAKIDELSPNLIGSSFVKGDKDQDRRAIMQFTAVADETIYGGGLLNIGGEKIYIIDYQFFISTITGAIMAYLFLCFCFDAAIRMVKLGFLQLIAPIPIVMSLAPGQKKNPLSSWGSECLSTFASLFLRLAVVYLAFFIIDLMFSVTGHGVIDTVTGENTTGFMGLFVNLFAVIGALLFAKEAPKLIESLFGIKGSGSLTLNPLKKFKEISDVPVAGGLFMGASALAGGLAGSALTGAWGLGRAAVDGISGNGQARTRLRETGARFGSHLGASFTGAGSHVAAGFTGGKAKGVHDRYKDNLNNIKEGYKQDYLVAKGEEYYQKAEKYGKSSIFENKNVAQAFDEVNATKDMMNSLRSQYNIAKADFDKGISDKTAEEIDQMLIAANKADSDYKYAKEVFDKQLKSDKKSAEIYEAYSAADSRHSMNKRLKEFQNGSTPVNNQTEPTKSLDDASPTGQDLPTPM